MMLFLVIYIIVLRDFYYMILFVVVCFLFVVRWLICLLYLCFLYSFGVWYWCYLFIVFAFDVYAL